MDADELHSRERPRVLVVSAEGRVVRRNASACWLSPAETRAVRMAAFAHLRGHRHRVVTTRDDGDVLWTFAVIGERRGPVFSVATGVDWHDEDAAMSARSEPSLDGPLPMVSFDRASCRLVAANEAALHEYGYSADELPSHSVEDICAAGEQEHLVDVLVSIADEPRWTGPWRQQRKDGSTFDAEFCWMSMEAAGRLEAVGLLRLGAA